MKCSLMVFATILSCCAFSPLAGSSMPSKESTILVWENKGSVTNGIKGLGWQSGDFANQKLVISLWIKFVENCPDDSFGSEFGIKVYGDVIFDFKQSCIIDKWFWIEREMTVKNWGGLFYVILSFESLNRPQRIFIADFTASIHDRTFRSLNSDGTVNREFIALDDIGHQIEGLPLEKGETKLSKLEGQLLGAARTPEGCSLYLHYSDPCSWDEARQSCLNKKMDIFAAESDSEWEKACSFFDNRKLSDYGYLWLGAKDMQWINRTDNGGSKRPLVTFGEVEKCQGRFWNPSMSPIYISVPGPSQLCQINFSQWTGCLYMYKDQIGPNTWQNRPCHMTSATYVCELSISCPT